MMATIVYTAVQAESAFDRLVEIAGKYHGNIDPLSRRIFAWIADTRDEAGKVAITKKVAYERIRVLREEVLSDPFAHPFAVEVLAWAKGISMPTEGGSDDASLLPMQALALLAKQSRERVLAAQMRGQEFASRVDQRLAMIEHDSQARTRVQEIRISHLHEQVGAREKELRERKQEQERLVADMRALQESLRQREAEIQKMKDDDDDFCVIL